jgi:hypothetical protein
MESDEQSVLQASLTMLVNRFQDGVMDLYTALLEEKRGLFLGVSTTGFGVLRLRPVRMPVGFPSPRGHLAPL